MPSHLRAEFLQLRQQLSTDNEFEGGSLHAASILGPYQPVDDSIHSWDTFECGQGKSGAPQKSVNAVATESLRER
jgi:hypothetical protein